MDNTINEQEIKEPLKRGLNRMEEEVDKNEIKTYLLDKVNKRGINYAMITINKLYAKNTEKKNKDWNRLSEM